MCNEMKPRMILKYDKEKSIKRENCDQIKQRRMEMKENKRNELQIKIQ